MEATKKITKGITLSVGTKVYELNNEKKTQYLMGNFEVSTKSGEIMTIGARIYVNSPIKPAVGDKVDLEIQAYEGKLYFTHKPVAESLSADLLSEF